MEYILSIDNSWFEFFGLGIDSDDFFLFVTCSGPVVCMVWEGKEAVSTGRKMLGATNPLESAPGTIRGDFCIEVGRNICHGSDSVENAEKEIALWFEEGEVLDWESHSKDWLYE